MRVLHVETGRHLYGGALQVRFLLEGLSALGVENHLVAPPGSAIALEAAPFCTLHETPVAGDADIRFLFRLLGAIRRVRPDVFHVHSRRGADLWGAAAARLTGVPALVTRRVDNPESKLFCRLKYGPYGQIVAISREIARVLVHQGVPARRIEVIPSAVAPQAFGVSCDRKWFESEFPMAAGGPVVGVIAQLIKRKGHRDLIDALPRILKACPSARFIFFGKGPEKSALLSHCRDRGVYEQVHFAGFRPDLPRILPCLDVVAHPAVMEGLGVALLQASAAGVPIVACRAGGIPEVVESGINGLLVPPRSPESLAVALIGLLGDPAWRRLLGKQGRRRAIERFSVERMVNSYCRLYGRLAAAKGHQPS